MLRLLLPLLIIVAVTLNKYAIATAAVTATTTTTTAAKTSYTVWCVGDGCGADKSAAGTAPGVVLMGGGTDTDEAFLWQIQKANGGDFVVMRASGDDAYNTWILDMSIAAGVKLNSVRTILFKTVEASSDPDVLAMIQNAEAIFFAGGDQSDYINLWVGTDVQRIVQSKIATTTIGGTSAGCAVEGGAAVYTGEKGSITSEDALANPYHRYMTLAPAFLHIPFLESLITDTHFVTRDRMGRMLTFTARILKDQMLTSESLKKTNSSSSSNITAITTASVAAPISLVRAVGIDEHTALLLDINSGDVNIVGVGTAYVCTANHMPETCEDKTPLTFSNLGCTRLDAAKKDTFSFSTFTGSGVSYTNDILNGVISSNPYGPKF